MRNTLLLFCCVACFSTGLAQEHRRYFEIAGWGNSATTLAAKPVVEPGFSFWDRIAYMLDSVESDYKDKAHRALPNPISPSPLPDGPRRVYKANIAVQTERKMAVKVLILNAAGREMATAPPMRLLPATSFCQWREKFLLPAGNWRYQVVTFQGKVLATGEISPSD